MLINLGNGHWAYPADILRIWVDRRLFSSKHCLWVGFRDGYDFYIPHPTQRAAENEANRIAAKVNDLTCRPNPACQEVKEENE